MEARYLDHFWLSANPTEEALVGFVVASDWCLCYTGGSLRRNGTVSWLYSGRSRCVLLGTLENLTGLPPLHPEHLGDLALDVPLGLLVFQVDRLVALDGQTEQLVLQPVPVARLGHVHAHDARALGPCHVEVHSKVRRPVSVGLGRVREGSGARPLVGGGFAEGLDLPGRT